MRRLQHVLGMLIAMFALSSLLMLGGCGGGNDAEDAADEAGDAMEEAGDAAEDAMDDATDGN